MNKTVKTLVQTISSVLTLSLLFCSLAQAGMAAKSSSFFPSLDSIFKAREAQSKQRLLKNLQSADESTVQETSKDEWKGKSYSGKKAGKYNKTTVHRQERPVSKTPQKPLPAKPRPQTTVIPVFIPYDDTAVSKTCFVQEAWLRKLKSSQDTKNDTAEDITGPAMAVISSSYDVNVTAKGAQVSGNLQVEVFQKGYFILPVAISSPSATTSLKVNGVPATTVFQSNANDGFLSGNNLRIALTGPGKHLIEFTNHTQISTDKNEQSSFSFRVPDTMLGKFTMSLPGKDLHVSISPASQLKKTVAGTAEKSPVTHCSCYLKPTDTVQVRWYEETDSSSLSDSLPALSAERKLAPPKKKPIITCSTFNEVTFSDGLASVATTLRYNISQAEVDTLMISVPKDLQLLTVKGPSQKLLKTWKRTGENVAIYLPSPRKGDITVTTLGEMVFLDKMKKTDTSRELELTLPFVSPLNTISPQSFIGLRLGKSLSPDFGESNDFANITPHDLPSWLPKGQTKGLTCFKAMTVEPHTGPYLKLTREKLSFADSFQIQNAKAITLLTKESRSQTKVIMTIINSRKQFLPMKLPEGSQFQSLFVDSSPAKAGIPDPNEPTALLIPLNKSPLNHKNKAIPFDVELVYTTPIRKIGSFGDLEIKGFVTDEVIENMTWEVRYPKTLMFAREDGSLEERTSDYFTASLADGEKKINKARRRMSQLPQTQAQAWSNDYQLDQNAAINIPFGRDALQNTIPVDLQAKSKTEGTFPVRISIPETGAKALFSGGNIDTTVEQPWLRLSYSRREYVKKIENVFSIATFLATIILLFNLWNKKNLKIPLAILLVTVAGNLLLFTMFNSSPESSLSSAISAFFVVVVYGAFYPIRKRLHTQTAAILILAVLLLQPALLLAQAKATSDTVRVFIPFKDTELKSKITNYRSGGYIATSTIQKVEELKEMARKQKEQSQAERTKPATEASLRSTTIHAFSQGSTVNLKIDNQFSTTKDMWIEIPVIKTFGSAVSATLDNEQTPLTINTDHVYSENEGRQNRLIVNSLSSENANIEKTSNPLEYFIPVKKKGTHTASIEMILDEEPFNNSWKGFSFVAGPYQVRTLNVRIKGLDLKVSIPQAKSFTLKEDRTSGETFVEAALGNSSQTVTVKWLKKTTFTTVAAPLAPITEATDVNETVAKTNSIPVINQKEPEHIEREPLITAAICTRTVIDETQLNGTVFVDYKVDRAPVEVLKLQVPSELRISRLHGNLHRDHRVIKGKTKEFNELVVLLKRKSRGTIIIGFDFTYPLKDFSGETIIQIPTVTSLDTTLVSGAIGIERSGNIEMLEHPDSKGVWKTTFDKLPSAYQSYLSQKSWLIYRFRNPQWVMKVVARKHPAMVGYTATIESAVFTTNLNRRGSGETRGTMKIRNFGASFLELETAPGTSKLKELFIDGEEETPIALSKRNILRIPLRKPTQEKDYAEYPMEITLKFTHSLVSSDNLKTFEVKSVAGKKAALVLPRMNLPVTGEGLIWNIRMNNKKHHISGFASSKFRQIQPYGTSTVGFFESSTDNSIRLHIPWLPGYSDVSSDENAKEMVVYLTIRSSAVSYVLFIIVWLLAFGAMNGVLIYLSDIFTPWYNPKTPLYTVGALILLLTVECFAPGNATAAAMGLATSPIGFIVWYLAMRLRKGNLLVAREEGDAK